MLQALGIFPTSKGEVDKKGFLVFRQAIELQQPLTTELGTVQKKYMNGHVYILIHIHTYIHAYIHTSADHFRLGYLPERLQIWATLKSLIQEIKDFKKFQEESGIVPETSSNTDGCYFVFLDYTS